MKTKIIQTILISFLITSGGFACLFSPAVQGEMNPEKGNSLTSLITGLIGLTRSSNTTSSGNANSSTTGTSTGMSTGNGSTTSTGTGITTVSAPSNLVYAGSPYTFTNGLPITTQTPTVTGTVTSCAVTPSLPTGLSINATTCAISGTPTVNQAATSYTITASNSNGNTTVSVSITVNIAPPANLVYTGSPYTFTNGSAITTQTPTITGTVTSCSANPSLPTGLSINATTCAISGTPTVNQGATSYTITASNSSGSATKTISITINIAAPSNLVYIGSPYTFTNGSAITTQTPTVTGTVTSCAVTPSLPTGLSINATTCAISGTPTINQGATSYTITASNAFGNTTASISVTVNMAAPSSLVYSGSPFTFTNGVAITTQTPTVTGTVTSCSTSPSLPTGLSIHTTTCAISGTPTVNQAATSYTITASNSSGNTTKVISIAVNAPVTSPSALVYSGTPYTFTRGTTITAITPTLGGGIPMSCSSSPSLPTGLSINNTSCEITGTPNLETSKMNYTITATNSGGSTNAIISIDVKICYTWGCFQDMGNGIVQFDGNAGTFGGNTYSAQTLYFKKCRQGQMWNSTNNDCTGWGSSPDYLAGTYKFCSTTNNNCNGGITSNELGVGGFLSGSTSTAYTSCNNLGIYAGHTNWRVPTKNELKTLIHCTNMTMPNDGSDCGSGNYVSPASNNLFLNSNNVDAFWSSTTYTSDSSVAWVVRSGGWVALDGKDISDSVRCVTGQ